MVTFGDHRMDMTCGLLCAMLNLPCVEMGYVWKAQSRMKDDFDRELVESWMRLQFTVGERLDRDHNEGRIDNSQLEFILDLLAQLDHYDYQEALTQFFVWCEWVRGPWE